MEMLLASAIGALIAAGIYLLLRARTFPVVLGLTLLSHAANLFILSMGRLTVGLTPIVGEGGNAFPDPLPQALVLTAIVINFGMTAFVVILALRTRLQVGSDHVDCRPVDMDGEEATGDRVSGRPRAGQGRS